MTATKIKYILLVIISAFFNELHADLPKDLIYTANTQEIIEVTQRLEALQTVWLLIPTAQSFENQVIQKMATLPRWQTLRFWHPPTFEEYHRVVAQEKLTILHQEPHRTLLKGPQLRLWLETELAPKLGIADWEVKDFADEFLAFYKQDAAVCRELLAQLQVKE